MSTEKSLGIMALSLCLCIASQTQLPAGYCQNTAPKRTLLKGQVSELALFCMAAGISLDSLEIKDGQTKVLRVKTGSPAYYCGVLEGDRVSQIVASDDALTLNLTRQNKIYRTKIPIKLSAVRARLSQIDLPNHEKETISPPIKYDPTKFIPSKHDKELCKLLDGYEVVFLVDRSDSMEGGLGIGPQDISRWTWCRRELSNFAAFMENCSGSPREAVFKVVPFNGEFQINHAAKPLDLERIFNEITPRGTTNLYAPMQSVIQDYFDDHALAAKKGLLIIVLTDGLPNQGDKVDELIINTSKMMGRSDQVVISLIEVGKTEEADRLFSELDNELVGRGASSDIVGAKHFEEVLRDGLKETIYQALAQTLVK